MICFDFHLESLNNLLKEPIIKISEVKKETKIKTTKNISQRYEKNSITNKKDLFKVIGRFFNRIFLLGIKQST